MQSCPAPNSSPFVHAALPLRLALGGLMLFSGWMKLGIRTFDGVLPGPVRDSLDFYFAINAFKMGLPQEVMRAMSGIIPWAEFLAGLLVLIGLWTRAASMLIGLMMVAFILGIASVMLRGIEADCPCFGSIKLFCGAKLGSCHLIRNTIILAVSLLLMRTGGGLLAFDSLFAKRTGRA